MTYLHLLFFPFFHSLFYPMSFYNSIQALVYLENSDINSTMAINEILGFNYDPLIYTHNHTTISIDLDSRNVLFIPLKYKQVIQIKTLGFIIEYLKNGEYHYQLIYPFKFFNTYTESIVEKLEYDYN